MKKISLLLLTSLFIAFTLAAQWTVNLGPMHVHTRFIGDLQWQNDRILAAKGSNIYEFDPNDGICTGFTDRQNLPDVYRFHFFVRDISNDPSSSRLFLSGLRGYSANGSQAYAIAIHQPGEGYIQQLFFSDSLMYQKDGGPAMLETGNRQYWILGCKFVRQVSVTVAGTLQMDWEKPLPLVAGNNVNAAVKIGNMVYAVTQAGSFLAINLNGDVLNIKHHPGQFILNSLAPAGSEFMAVGSSSNSADAMVVKFDLSGNVLWQKLPGDKQYLVIGPNSGGGFLAGGSSADEKVVLIHLDHDGNLIERNTYLDGSCAQFLELPDGSRVIGASTGSLDGTYIFKTDASGQYSSESSPIRNRNRMLRFGDFSLNQIPSSTLFFDNSKSAFLHLPSNMASTVFSHSLWVGAKDTSGFLKVCASDYREPQSDYRLGHTNSIVSDFNRLWAVSKQQIQLLRRDFLDNGVLDEMPPYDLLTWPARGNVHFRFNPDFTRVSTKLDSLPAPFVDVNNDGTYNVYDGDYPVLKGDQMLWWVFNDQTEHKLSHSFPLGLDIAVSLYVFDCDESEVVAQSLFTDYQIINRSSNHYIDTYVGFHTDLDLGCYEDDYVGSLPEEHTYYVYNQDELDGVVGDTCPFGVSFGSSIPVQSVTFLNHSLDHMLYFNDNEPGTNPPSQDPGYAFEFYTYLKGRWRHDVPLTVGGTGYNPLDPSAVPTSLAFPGNPANAQDWTMCAEDLASGDLRTITSNGPFSWASGDTLSFQLAFTFHANVPHPCPDMDQWVKPAVQQLRQWFDGGILTSGPDLGEVRFIQAGQSVSLDATTPGALQYIWSTGQTTPVIEVTQQGTYSVTVTMPSGCERSASVLVKKSNEPVNIEIPSWRLNPNPATDFLEIQVDGNDGILEFVLLDMQGQVVRRSTVTGSTLIIPVSSLPSSMYIAELWRNDTLLGKKKVVVM